MMDIKSLTYINLEKFCFDNSIEKYRAKQIFEWIHKKKNFNIDSYSNISNNIKTLLYDTFLNDLPTIFKVFKSKIDNTVKFLIKLRDGNIIEAVFMTYEYGNSICISSQIGCNMGCKFCASTLNGCVRSLDTYEMLFEIYLIKEYLNININNIVIMGMGEPLNNINNVLDFIDIICDKNGENISKRNITISTCGLVPVIDNLCNKENKFTLALSLHAPNDYIRKKIMPIANQYNIDQTLHSMANYYNATKRRITIEYSLMKDINSSKDNAIELSNLLYKYFIKNHIDFNVNLIPVNEVEETGIKRPDANIIKVFKDTLENNNINVFIRRELGKDISGSCGQLRRSYITSKCEN